LNALSLIDNILLSNLILNLFLNCVATPLMIYSLAKTIQSTTQTVKEG
jgi:hypothetical protein